MEAYYAEGYIGSNSCTGRYLAMNAAPDGSTVYPLREQSAQVYVDGEAKSTRTLNMNGITINKDNGICVARTSQENQTLILTGEGCIDDTILEAGYVFQAENGSFVTYDTEITNSNTLNNVTVVPCDKHYDSDGDLKCVTTVTVIWQPW